MKNDLENEVNEKKR